MFEDPVECYQAMGEALANAAKQPWDRIVVEATLDGERVDVVAGGWQEGQSKAAFYLTGVPRLARYIFDLARLVSTDDKGVFKKLTFVLSSSGNYNADFVY